MITEIIPVHPTVRRDFAPFRALVLDSVSSPLTKILYGKALDEFFRWRAKQGQPAFTRASLQAHQGFIPYSSRQAGVFKKLKDTGRYATAELQYIAECWGDDLSPSRP